MTSDPPDVTPKKSPIMFGTLYFFGLIGLVMGILGDLMYTVVDPRIDFEGRG